MLPLMRIEGPLPQAGEESMIKTLVLLIFRENGGVCQNHRVCPLSRVRERAGERARHPIREFPPRNPPGENARRASA